MSKASEEKELKLLKRKCLFLWKACVKERAGKRCEAILENGKRCNKTKRLQIHHCESYSINKGLRYDPKNGFCLDLTHHKFGGYSAHKSFIMMDNLFRGERVADLYYLKKVRASQIELTNEYLLTQIELLTSELEYWTEMNKRKKHPVEEITEEPDQVQFDELNRPKFILKPRIK